MGRWCKKMEASVPGILGQDLFILARAWGGDPHPEGGVVHPWKAGKGLGWARRVPRSPRRRRAATSRNWGASWAICRAPCRVRSSRSQLSSSGPGLGSSSPSSRRTTGATCGSTTSPGSAGPAGQRLGAPGRWGRREGLAGPGRGLGPDGTPDGNHLGKGLTAETYEGRGLGEVGVASARCGRGSRLEGKEGAEPTGKGRKRGGA